MALKIVGGPREGLQSLGDYMQTWLSMGWWMGLRGSRNQCGSNIDCPWQTGLKDLLSKTTCLPHKNWRATWLLSTFFLIMIRYLWLEPQFVFPWTHNSHGIQQPCGCLSLQLQMDMFRMFKYSIQLKCKNLKNNSGISQNSSFTVAEDVWIWKAGWKFLVKHRYLWLNLHIWQAANTHAGLCPPPPPPPPSLPPPSLLQWKGWWTVILCLLRENCDGTNCTMW